MMNDLFPTPHPSLLLFVQIIEQEARHQVERLDNLRKGTAVARVLQGVTINEVPLVYLRFENIENV